MTTSSPLGGASVLVTGGTGSFGHAFVRRALDDGASRIVIFSRDELKQAAMRSTFANDARLRFFIGCVRDATRVRWAMRGVDILIHAAAMKRIEACASDPLEAVATNITGTANVAQAAIREGVPRAILLSTDKAPAATTLYGATKFTAERLWIASTTYAAGTETKLSAVRYGNVLGSRGSVLDLWRSQFANGERLTITDAKATRFWMRLSQAVDLVVLALDRMTGGETFIPKIGSAPILDLARAVVEGNGIYAPGHIETGLRSGERLHETLIAEDELRNTFDAGEFFAICPEEVPLRYKDPRPKAAYRSDTNGNQLSVDDLRRMIA